MANMLPNTSRLDADELLHLAMEAAKKERHDDAIGFLKRAIEISPTHAKSHYFLAAEHAQIGMYDRALEEMEKSVELDPSLHTAHFQIGLLHLTSGRIEAAIQAWQSLDVLGDGHPLYLFKTGMEYMVKDEFVLCREYLTKGIAINHVNADLNADMQRVMDELPAQSQSPQILENSGGSGHVFLSAYNKTPRAEE